jgi:8-oxo-dGTP diphosphatase
VAARQIVPAVKAFILRKEKVLLLHKNRKEKFYSEFDIPGGKIKFGETSEEVLKREVYEETRLDVRIIRPLSMASITRKNEQVVGTIFLCTAKGKVLLSSEHESYEWINVKKIKSGKYPKWIKDTALKI